MEGMEVDPFILSVSLSDIARAVDDARSSIGSDDGCVAEVTDADGRSVTGELHEGLDEGVVRVGFHRWAIDSLGVGEIEMETGSVGELGHFLLERLGGFAWESSSIDIDGAQVWDDVILEAAGDAADIEGGVSEQGMGTGLQNGLVIVSE